MQTITTGGWIFMIAAWLFILALNVYCFYNIFKKKGDTITDTQDVESKIDKSGK